MRVTVMHRSYGCESGCCGHVIEIDGEEVSGSFEFAHPYGDDPREWAKQFAEDHLGELGEHGADLDWENCVVSDD